MSVDRGELRRLANRATEGPWRVEGDQIIGVALGEEFATTIVYTVELNNPTYDAPYIAAANPAAVLELLDERDALEDALNTIMPGWRAVLPGLGRAVA